MTACSRLLTHKPHLQDPGEEGGAASCPMLGLGSGWLLGSLKTGLLLWPRFLEVETICTCIFANHDKKPFGTHFLSYDESWHLKSSLVLVTVLLGDWRGAEEKGHRALCCWIPGHRAL